MGSCCCHAETPCASLEEKSGLLAGKTAAPPETGIEGAFPDSPTSDGRKASMDEIKEGEMKEEQIRAEEKTSVTAQVRQGENTPSMRQENGVVQKESVCTEAVVPPPRHQSSAGGHPDPQLQPLPAAEAPDVAVTATVVVATPEKQTTTAAVAEERCPPLSTSQEVTDAHCEGERRNSPEGLRKEESPKSLLPALGGFSPQKISNTQLLSQPPPFSPQTPTTRPVIPEGDLEEGSSSPDLQVCSLELQVCGEVPVGRVVEQIHSPELQVCGEGPSRTVQGLSNTVHDSPLGPHSTGPSDVLGPETDCPVDSRQREPTPMEEELHSDPPSELRTPPTELRTPPTELRDPPSELRTPPSELRTPPSELRDPNETLEKPLEDEPRTLVTSSLGSWLLCDPLPLRVNQDQQEVGDVQQEAVWKGGGQEEEGAAGRVRGGRDASIEPMETSVGGEGKETPAAAGGDEEEEMDDENEEEKEEEEGRKGVPMVDQGESDEDIYTAKEDMYSSPSSSEVTPLKVEESCSLAPMVDLLSYSQREWRGNTTKSALIRKGYQQMMEWFGGVRRVRGDNYCALRATLFQVLSQTTQSPAWLQQDHFTMLPGELEDPDGLLSQWLFPGEYQSGDGRSDVTQRLKGYIELLRNTWAAAADCPTAEERQRLCEGVFQGGREELGLMEALKLLMLGCAAALHRSMEQGHDVPVFCWLLFARDTSPCPRTFLTNHLRQVGVSGGLEQVEMFLLGYALRCTIKVYRLYMSGTEEFLTYYPDDHRDDWPAISLVTEDDRHYNVPVVTATAEPEAASR